MSFYGFLNVHIYHRSKAFVNIFMKYGFNVMFLFWSEDKQKQRELMI